MNRKPLLAAACSLLAAAALTAQAAAATVERDPAGGVRYVAGPGADDLLVALDAASVRITDAGATATLPDGCERRSDDVACAAASLRIELGDGDDRLVVTSVQPGVPLTVDGGAGADRLQGGGGDDVLLGGPGDDAMEGLGGADALDGGDGDDDLQGGAGPDRLLAGPGDDAIAGDGANPPAPDVVDGGDGRDTFADYGRTTGDEGTVALTLASGADDGFPGEGDDVRGVETISVTSPGRVVGTDADEALYGIASALDAFVLDGRGGDDELRAPGGADRLLGGPGDDTLIGGFGADVLVGGPGRDRVFGDTAPGYCAVLECTLPHGDDRVDVRDGARDVVRCGPGRDAVRADARDRIAADCERVTRGGGAAPRARVAQLGRIVERDLAVEVAGTHTVRWTYRSTDDPPACSSWTEGEGTQTMRVRTARPTRYDLLIVGRRPPVIGPTELQRNEGTVARTGRWIEHPDPCTYCGPASEFGPCDEDDAAPPEPARFDCSRRAVRNAQAIVGLLSEGQSTGDDLVAPLHGDALVVAIGGDAAFEHCPPTVRDGGVPLGRAATPFQVPIAGAAYRRVLRLRRGEAVTLRETIEHGWRGDRLTHRCGPPPRVGLSACATTDVEVTIRRAA